MASRSAPTCAACGSIGPRAGSHVRRMGSATSPSRPASPTRVTQAPPPLAGHHDAREMLLLYKAAAAPFKTDRIPHRTLPTRGADAIPPEQSRRDPMRKESIVLAVPILILTVAATLAAGVGTVRDPSVESATAAPAAGAGQELIATGGFPLTLLARLYGGVFVGPTPRR